MRPDDQSAFIDLVTDDQTDAPAYFTYDAVLNSKEVPPGRNTGPRGQSLTLISCWRCATWGHRSSTTARDRTEFARRNLAGSINVGLGGQYAKWAGHHYQPRSSDRLHRGPGSRA